MTPVPVSVIARLEECPDPTYRKVVPAAIEISGVPPPVPKELLDPELAKVLAMIVPALIVTAPV